MKEKGIVKAAAAGIILALTLTGVYLLAKPLEKKAAKKNETKEKRGFVAPPLKSADVAFSLYEIDSEKENIFKTPAGTEIKIPANALLTKEGKNVTSKVSLRYREFPDAGDIFLSGIPMQYDSAGQTFHFESAGMFEMYVFQNNETLSVKQGYRINVNLASGVEGEEFNIYYLDTVKKQWVYIAEDTPLKQPMQEVSPGKTPTVLLPAKNYPSVSFRLNYDVNEFPELKELSDVRFSPVTKELMDTALFTGTWEDMTMESNAQPGVYTLVLTKGMEKKALLVSASGKNGTALTFENYKKRRKERIKKSALKKRQSDSLYLSQRAFVSNENNNLSRTNRLAGEGISVEQTIIRSFSVSKFRIWNSDCPKSMPRGMLVNAVFTDTLKNKLTLNNVYLVEAGKRAVYTIYSYAFDTFTFNPGSSNMIWAITPGNKLAVVSSSRFKKTKKKKQEMNFEMIIYETKSLTNPDVKSILALQ